MIEIETGMPFVLKGHKPMIITIEQEQVDCNGASEPKFKYKLRFI